MACQGTTLLRAVAAELPVLTRSCSMKVGEYTMERTNSIDSMLVDFLARTNSGTIHGTAAPETTAVPAFTSKRGARNLSINTSVENVFHCLASPGDAKSSPTLPTLSRTVSFDKSSAKSSPTLPTLSRTVSKDSPFGSILGDVLDVPMRESSLIEPPVESTRPTNCMHQLDAQQISQALSRARSEYNMLDAQQPVPASSLCSEPNNGPYGPYNPCPSYMLEVQRLERLSAPYQIPAPPPPPDEYAGRTVTMVRGKYTGRKAFVQHRVNKKYRVQVEGVAWGLEFYADMFTLD